MNSVNQVEFENKIYNVTMATLLILFFRVQCVICHNILAVTCAFRTVSFKKKMASRAGELSSCV